MHIWNNLVQMNDSQKSDLSSATAQLIAELQIKFYTIIANNCGRLDSFSFSTNFTMKL